MKNIANIFAINQKILSPMPGIGDNQPPKNIRAMIAHMSHTAINSPIINNKNGVDEYSTWYPATNSASASGKSKGGLFVSARADMKNKNTIGKCGNQYQLSKQNSHLEL